MQIVRWHLAATASAEASTVAPAATSGATLARLMSCTTSSNPALTRLSAIGPPILPSAIKPTVLVIDFLLSNSRRRATRFRGQCYELFALAEEEQVAPNEERAGVQVDEACQGGVDL